MTPINLANIRTEWHNTLVDAILEAPAIRWCKVHEMPGAFTADDLTPRYVHPTATVCPGGVVDFEACAVVSARVVEVEEASDGD